MSIFFLNILFVGSVFFFLYALWGVFMGMYLDGPKTKKMAFECGFLPISNSRVPFSIRFFFVLIMFVVFDVEMSLFLQFPFQLEKNMLKGRVFFLLFFGFLMGCLMEEWRRGALNWK